MQIPYNQKDCIHEIKLTLSGIVCALRSDSWQFLNGMKSLFWSSSFFAHPSTEPQLICYCATQCESPWVLAIETPGGLHLARPHPRHEAVFEFDEWSSSGCKAVGQSWIPLTRAISSDQAARTILTAYVRKRLLRAVVNQHAPTNLRILHAAALQYNTQGLLILGDSRSGKSTLALAGLLHGMRYLAEDSTIVDLDQGMVLSFPTPFRLRQGTLGMFPAFLSLPHETIHDMTGDVRQLVDPRDITECAIGSPVKLSHILQLKNQAPQPRIDPGNSADLAQACIRADFFASGVDGDGLDTLWQWAGQVQQTVHAYLHTGPMEATIALIKAWMDDTAG